MGLPTVELETGRLVLRPLGLAELDDFVSLHDDPEVTRFVTRFQGREAEERLRASERDWTERGFGMFAVRERESSRFLGRTGLKHWPQFDEIEIGWILRRDAWGHGYATEAAGACVEWGFSSFDFPYLTAMIQPENEASVRVADRLGFTPLRRDVLLGEDVIVFSLSRPEP